MQTSETSELLSAVLPSLPDRQLRNVNLDIFTLVARVRAAVPGLREVEEEMRQQWREPPVGQVDRLLQCASALEQAHVSCLDLQATLPDPGRLAKELKEVLSEILSALDVLCKVGVLHPSVIAPYRRINGHRSLARSVLGIVAACHVAWPQIHNRTWLSRDELSRALQLNQQFVVVIYDKHRGCSALRGLLRQRQQLFTLLLSEYSSLRAAARFMYRRAGAEQRVPSLYRKAPGARVRASGSTT